MSARALTRRRPRRNRSAAGNRSHGSCNDVPGCTLENVTAAPARSAATTVSSWSSTTRTLVSWLWLLYDQESPSASRSLGLTLGRLWKQDGSLVATVAQQGLVRPLPAVQ